MSLAGHDQEVEGDADHAPHEQGAAETAQVAALDAAHHGASRGTTAPVGPPISAP